MLFRMKCLLVGLICFSSVALCIEKEIEYDGSYRLQRLDFKDADFESLVKPIQKRLYNIPKFSNIKTDKSGVTRFYINSDANTNILLFIQGFCNSKGALVAALELNITGSEVKSVPVYCKTDLESGGTIGKHRNYVAKFTIPQNLLGQWVDINLSIANQSAAYFYVLGATIAIIKNESLWNDGEFYEEDDL